MCIFNLIGMLMIITLSISVYCQYGSVQPHLEFITIFICFPKSSNSTRPVSEYITDFTVYNWIKVERSPVIRRENLAQADYLQLAKPYYLLVGISHVCIKQINILENSHNNVYVCYSYIIIFNGCFFFFFFEFWSTMAHQKKQ